jgi:hypothetical protein
MDAVDALGVHERDQVLHHAGLAVVAVGRGGAPAEPAEVDGQHAEALGQRADDAPPQPPVLRPAVHREDRGRVWIAGFGDVHPDSGSQLRVAVCDPG